MREESGTYYKYGTITEYDDNSNPIKRYTLDVNEPSTHPIASEKEIAEYKIYLEQQDKNELTALRQRREEECFSVVNRGKLWYDILNDVQVAELNTWYAEWLNVTETKSVPDKPTWLVEV